MRAMLEVQSEPSDGWFCNQNPYVSIYEFVENIFLMFIRIASGNLHSSVNPLLKSVTLGVEITPRNGMRVMGVNQSRRHVAPLFNRVSQIFPLLLQPDSRDIKQESISRFFCVNNVLVDIQRW